MKHFLLVLALFTIGLSLTAQESILLNSGKRIYIQAINLDSAAFVFYKTQSGHIKALDKEEVFSWTRTDSVEVIFYQPACADVCFQIEQMRDYLHGVADAKELKRPIPVVVGSVAGGAAGAFIMPILSPLVPTAVAAGYGIPRPKIEHFNIPEKYKDNPHYAEGYTSTVRRKRVINALIGGGIGLVAGITTMTILTKQTENQ
jgi:hypothetical protein